MANDERARPEALTLDHARDPSPESTSTSASVGMAPRTPRFAEATSVHSPIEQKMGDFPITAVSEAQPGDIGFGYINKRESVAMPMSPRSPLKSAMRAPGTPGRALANPLSPTFKEEQLLEDKEAQTSKEQARDLRIKTRVRLAKFALRSVNFSCSLIVVAMITSSLSIFRATESLPSMNGLPPWAENTNAWPQKVVLAASCFSLAVAIGVFIGYCRGGHRRAEKVGVYYTLFAVAYFIFSMIMWCAAAGILQFTRKNSNNKDLWGWACVQNTRSTLFSQKVDYALVCRLQDWSLVCACIEIVLECISITLYSVIFYRYYTKRRLHKSMNMRDKARSDLYLAQLRTQSAPNTPGFGPKSPAFSAYALSPRFPPNAHYRSLSDVDGDGASPFTPGGMRLVVPQSFFAAAAAADADASRPATAFSLQAPPRKANPATPVSPKVGLGEFPPPTTASSAPMVDGEQMYESVPIPGAYAGQAVKIPPPAKM